METSPPLIPDSDAIRNRYLNHEASIRAIGSLYLLGCVLLVMIGFNALIGSNTLKPSLLSGILYIMIGVVEGWVGVELRKLNPRVKAVATVLAIFGLLAFPIGTLINVYVLYLLHSAKGKYVFSPEYRAVIEATPHIRYRWSVVTWILISLIAAMLLFALVATQISKH